MKRKIFNRFMSFTLASAMTLSCASLQTYAGTKELTKVTAYEEQGTAYPAEGGNIYISGMVLTKADETVSTGAVEVYDTKPEETDKTSEESDKESFGSLLGN